MSEKFASSKILTASEIEDTLDGQGTAQFGAYATTPSLTQLRSSTVLTDRSGQPVKRTEIISIFALNARLKQVGPDGLVPDSHPFFDARFAYRELHPFRGNRARSDEGR
jgi:hypothetical protein